MVTFPSPVLNWHFRWSYIIKYVIERLDQGHLYPQGEHPGDKHQGYLRRGTNPGRLRHRRALYLKSYLDMLYADYSEPLNRCPSACGVKHGLTWRRLVSHMLERFRIIAVARTYDFYPNSTNSHADHDHVGVTTVKAGKSRSCSESIYLILTLQGKLSNKTDYPI